MIPEFYIQQWKENAPWVEPYMVEQDLIICRALVSIFSDDFWLRNLPFAAEQPCTSYTLRLSPDTARTLTWCK